LYDLFASSNDTNQDHQSQLVPDIDEDHWGARTLTAVEHPRYVGEGKHPLCEKIVHNVKSDTGFDTARAIGEPPHEHTHSEIVDIQPHVFSTMHEHEQGGGDDCRQYNSHPPEGHNRADQSWEKGSCLELLTRALEGCGHQNRHDHEPCIGLHSQLGEPVAIHTIQEYFDPHLYGITDPKDHQCEEEPRPTHPTHNGHKPPKPLLKENEGNEGTHSNIHGNRNIVDKEV
jgi:hypothetical protein